MSDFLETGNIMIIPLFQDTKKAPNNTTIGLSRSASITVKSAISSEVLKERKVRQFPYGQKNVK